MSTSSHKFGFTTRQLHAGQQADPATGAAVPPLYQTAAYRFRDTEYAARLFNLEEKGHIYSRISNPTNEVLELRLADLEGGSGAIAAASGHAAQALAILEKYGIAGRVPGPVRCRIERGARGEIEETPKTLGRVQNLVVGSNRLAVDAAAKKARELGYRPLVLSTRIQGETREIARMHAAIALEPPVRPPVAIISGGETTVTLRGNGLGGRNQEFVLAAAIELAGAPGVTVLSAGTDGTDGPTDAAGAIADSTTLARGSDARRFLDANDSYHYFQPLGDLIKTGPTGTNVMDIRLLLVDRPASRDR